MSRPNSSTYEVQEKARMRKFDTKLLVPGRGEFGPHPLEGLFIRIPLDPFLLDGAKVETSVRLDFVRLPDSRLDALAHQLLSFLRTLKRALLMVQSTLTAPTTLST